jgi:hypothetical protein
MRFNLIVGGIKSEGAIENTENVVKHFLVDELLIPADSVFNIVMMFFFTL